MISAISPLESRIIRFAVGNEANPTSFIWKLWIQKNDVYLLPSTKPDPKFSMHRNVWKIDTNTHRHTFKPIPCSNAPGWVQGPAVMFCHVPYNPTPPPEEVLFEARTRKNIHWVDMPAEWHMSEFVVFFENADVNDAELPPADSTIRSDLQVAIGPLILKDGRRIWLRCLTKPIAEDRKEYLLDIRRTIIGINVNKKANDLRSIGIVKKWTPKLGQVDKCIFC